MKAHDLWGSFFAEAIVFNGCRTWWKICLNRYLSYPGPQGVLFESAVIAQDTTPKCPSRSWRMSYPLSWKNLAMKVVPLRAQPVIKRVLFRSLFFTARSFIERSRRFSNSGSSVIASLLKGARRAKKEKNRYIEVFISSTLHQFGESPLNHLFIK